MKKIVSFAVLALLGLVKVSNGQELLLTEGALNKLPNVQKPVLKQADDDDCLSEGDEPCEVDGVCEGTQVCLKNSQGSRACYPAICKEFMVRRSQKKSHTKKHNQVKRRNNYDDCFGEYTECSDAGDCEGSDKVCLKNENGDGYCYQSMCQDLQVAMKKVNGRKPPKDPRIKPSNKKKQIITKHFKEDDVFVNQDSRCFQKGDPCESNNTCENGEICLNDSLDEGFCYPGFCADVLQVQYHKKGKKTNKKSVATEEIDECFEKTIQCGKTPDCQGNKICLFDNTSQGYCFPRYCIDIIME